MPAPLHDTPRSEPPSRRGWSARFAAMSRSRAVYVVVSLLLLAPCHWQPRLTEGDLSSHNYSSWLARLIESGRAEGLKAAHQTTNVLFDLILGGLTKIVGAGAAQGISVSLAVLTFVWGAFAFVSVVSGRRAWHLMPAHRHAGLRMGLPHGAVQFLSESRAVLLGPGSGVGMEALAAGRRGAHSGARLSRPLAAGVLDGRLVGVPVAGRPHGAPDARLAGCRFSAGHGPVARAGRPLVYLRVVPSAGIHDLGHQHELDLRHQVLRGAGGIVAGLGDAVSGVVAPLGNAPRGFEQPLPTVRRRLRGGFRPAGCVG